MMVQAGDSFVSTKRGGAVWFSKLGHIGHIACAQKVAGSNPRLGRVISPLGPRARHLTPAGPGTGQPCSHLHAALDK